MPTLNQIVKSRRKNQKKQFKYFGATHARENARRKRQIERGILKGDYIVDSLTPTK